MFVCNTMYNVHVCDHVGDCCLVIALHWGGSELVMFDIEVMLEE